MEPVIDGRQNALDRHLRNSWANTPHVDDRWDAGPIEEILPGFRVRCIEPTDPSEAWVYVSMGASITGEGAHEFALLSPCAFQRHVETVTMVAHWQAAGRNADVGSVLALGWPWMEGSEADHLLVAPLYAYPSGYDSFRDGDKEVSILWLIPIYANEAAYVRRRGFEHLEERFEKADVNLLDPRRGSVLGTSAIS
ncbi:suppressor of fused domain protein [Streptomyces sp. NPDC085596]|uniref:suppressor of fused domain protein n=1 Tax=Streptomyces sp. NPDC085596 TaxID=3365731 RepID=UPI0037D80BFC